MRYKIQAIVLGKVHHNERTDIATLYTPQTGRISVAVPAVKNKPRRGGNPPLMPLSVIEGEISHRSGSELASLWRFALLESFAAMRSDPYKSAVGIFIAEFLDRLLHEQASEPIIWRTVISAMRILDAERNLRRVANFHIVMLWQMLAPTGITPDLTSRRQDEQQWLDMRTGLYTSVRPNHGDIVAPEYADLPQMLARLNFRNSHVLRLNGEQRYILCEALLHYYAVHLPGLSRVHSHHILRTLFC